MQLHLEIPETLGDFISINLIGSFKTTTNGNHCTLTVIYLMTDCHMYTHTRQITDIVVNPCLEEVYCRMGQSQKIPSDNKIV